MELIDYIKKFKELCAKIKADLEGQIVKKENEVIALTIKIETGRKHAGEIRGHVKALVKEIDKHGDVEEDTIVKLGEFKKSLDDHLIAFDEDGLVKRRDFINAEIKKLYENITIVTVE